MGRIRVNTRELVQLQQNIDRLDRQGLEDMNVRIIKELAKRFLREVVLRTPVGEYDDGRVGGTLQRNWTVQNNNLNVRRNGANYELEIVNSTEYASYVEFGHRTVNGGWVNGRFFMTIAVDEVEGLAPHLVEREVNKVLRRAFDGN
jgi:hypothetical protein